MKITISLVDDSRGTSLKMFERVMKKEEVDSMLHTLLSDQDLEIRIPGVNNLSRVKDRGNGEYSLPIGEDLDAILRSIEIEDDPGTGHAVLTLALEAEADITGVAIEDVKIQAVVHMCQMLFRALKKEGVL